MENMIKVQTELKRLRTENKQLRAELGQLSQALDASDEKIASIEAISGIFGIHELILINPEIRRYKDI